MNVQLPGKPEGYKRRIVIYTIIIIVCVIAVGVAIYQFFSNERLGVIIGVTNQNDEEIEKLKSEFNTIFNNNIDLQSVENKDKTENYENLVYTEYRQQEKDSNNYDLNVNIPIININSALAIKYNSEIKEKFEEPAKYIEQTQSKNISYTVNYVASIKDNILSLAILATFKEGNSAQRTVVKTYNYDMTNNLEVKLDDLMKLNQLEKNLVTTKIETEIKKSQEHIEELKKMGYEIYTRDENSDIYKLENTTEFFMFRNHLYLVYAYGNNNNNTSEMDLVII